MLGTAYIVLTRDAHGQPVEVFLSVGKAGTDTYAATELLERLISLTLRLDSPVSWVSRARDAAAQLSGVSASGRESNPSSLPDAIDSELLASFDAEGIQSHPSPSSTLPTLLSELASKRESIPNLSFFYNCES